MSAAVERPASPVAGAAGVGWAERAVTEACPSWCTRETHPVWAAPTRDYVESAHWATLWSSDGREIDVYCSVEHAADGSLARSTTTIEVNGFDERPLGLEDVVAVAAALAQATAIANGAAA